MKKDGKLNKPNMETGWFGSLLAMPTFHWQKSQKQARGNSDTVSNIEWFAEFLIHGEPSGSRLKGAVWESKETLTDPATGKLAVATHYDAGWASKMAWESFTEDSKDLKKASLDYVGLCFSQWQNTPDGKGEVLTSRLVGKAGRTTVFTPVDE